MPDPVSSPSGSHRRRRRRLYLVVGASLGGAGWLLTLAGSSELVRGLHAALSW